MGLSISLFMFIRLLVIFLLLSLVSAGSDSSVKPLCDDDESIALLQFKESFIVNQSASFARLASPKISSWMTQSTDCCTWDGVQCDENTGHVIGLDLSSSFLYGSINSSSSLFQLVHLKTLNLAGNNFSHSEIPVGVSWLSKLTYLNLSYSGFSGQVPSEILHLSKLVSLDLHSNPLKIHKPGLKSIVEKLTNLEELDLSMVDISSTVPSILANLSSLTTINLRDCGLHGEFPTQIFQLPNLKSFCVRFNPSLSGRVPDFNKSSPLEVLSLAGTSFFGELPDSIGNLKFLYSLNVKGCNFSGPIPASFGNLTKLMYLDLSSTYLGNCGFHGEFPVGIFFLPNLKFLNVGFNPNLTGRVPEFNLSSPLESLILSGTCFSGKLPGSIGNLKSLYSLGAERCNFSGPIPASFGNLTGLVYLDLSCIYLGNCGFHGEFPVGIFFLPNLKFLNVGFNPNLTGRVPEFNISSPLEDLRLSGTSFSGKLPGSIGNLKSLYFLEAERCNFSGPIPASFGNLTGLVYLDLSCIYLGNCGFHGEFPVGIFFLPNLKFLNVGFNPNLTGRVPEFNISSPLEVLRLSGTSFSGKLPGSIGNLKSLYFLEAERCNFSGPIPLSFANLTELLYLDLSNNNFSRGTFYWIGKQTKLIRLDIYATNLQGDIPYSLGNLTQLTMLNLGWNELSGPIPYWLANLTQLNNLWLTHNNFYGPIPTSISCLSNLQVLDLFSNNLSGIVEFDLFRKLNNLVHLDLSLNNLSLVFDHNTNATYQNFKVLGLDSCHLSDFPGFLRNQDQLEVLELSQNKIHGQIPEWISNLSKDTLVILSLAENFLTGFDQNPNTLPWTNLQLLSLSGNKLQGSLPIPPPSIISYYVNNNMLGGEISHVICSLSSLSYLDFSYNNLSGFLPQCLGNLSNLSILSLEYNNFHGSIPQIFMQGCKLKMIHLNQNHFQGALPRSLVHCTMLKILDIGNNHISDSFPSWLGILPELRVLILQSNRFHGVIGEPKTNFRFPKLQVIDLSNNYITGKLPSEYFQIWKAMQSFEVGGLTYMQESEKIIGWSDIYNYRMQLTNKGIKTNYCKILDFFAAIDLSSNMFEGEIPKIVGNLKALRMLNLSNNVLTGSILVSLVNLTNLESLDLSQNMLVGEIPPQLAELTFLEFLNVSHNNLTGPIPYGEQFSTFQNSSFDGNAGLCGRPLSKQCTISEHSPPSPSSFTENQDSEFPFEFDWKVVVMGYGCGFIVGTFVGQIIIKKKSDWFMKCFAIHHPTERRLKWRRHQK